MACCSWGVITSCCDSFRCCLISIDMAGVQVLPGDVLLIDDEGVIAMPLELAEEIAALGPPKEQLEEWIRRVDEHPRA